MRSKGNYVDGFVFLVTKDNAKAYKKMAAEGAKVWKKFGALDYYECAGDDLTIKGMGDAPKQRSFTELTNAASHDTVWFSFIVFKNKAHRNAVNKKVMAHFSKKYAEAKDMAMPLDVTKMAYGGFKTIIHM